MKRLIFSALVLSAVTANAQVKDGMVGINTDEPRATMHIEPGVSESKGLIIPRITAAQMKTMTNLAHFGADHHAIITYLKETLPAVDRTGKLADVVDPGYYFYNHTAAKWQKFGGGGGEQDFKALPTSMPGFYNYLSKGSGIGGASLGTGMANIGIGGPSTFNFTNSTKMTGDNNIGLGAGVFQFLNGATMSSYANIGIGISSYTFNNGGNMSGSGYNIGMGNSLYTFQKANAQFSGGNNISIGQTIFNLANGDLTGGSNIGMGNGLYTLPSGDMEGSSNIGIGQSSYYVSNGNITNNAQNNIALGNSIYRLSNSSTSTFSGQNNIGIGNTLYKLTSGNLTGQRNIGMGMGVFNLSTGNFSGNDNIGIGNEALSINAGGLTGDHNIALGYQAMHVYSGDISGSKNIALGYSALDSGSNGYTGSNNIGIGEKALVNASANPVGNYNIGIGYNAGFYLVNGNGNIHLGNLSMGSDTAGQLDNVVVIGNGVSATSLNSTDNVILLGKTGSDAPKVGVGTYKPQAKLDVAGAVRVADDISGCTMTNRGTIRFDGTHFYGCDGSTWKQLDN